MNKVIRESPQKMRSGAACIYIPITKTICAKLYTRKVVRDQTYKIQRHAARFGLGPKVGDKFTYPVLLVNRWEEINVSNVVYGFLSQRAKITGRNSEKDGEYMSVRLNSIGICHDDMHTYNLGYIDGRLVCIDFDSLYSTES